MIYPGHVSHPQNKIVNEQLYGAGTVIALDLKGGQEAAFKFLNAIEVGVISNNLGDSKSIYTHPSTTTHQRVSDQQKKSLSITPGLIRFSVGLEDSEDLITDILQALE
jgi:O-succinylhomoserine sulfhydrylase